MTSIIERLQRRQDASPSHAPTPTRRILMAATATSVVTFLIAVVGLAVDHQTIGGEAAWVKPAKFGLSLTLYLWTLRWMLGVLPGHRRLTTAVAVVVTAVFVAETVWIDLQVLRGTTSHFNTADGVRCHRLRRRRSCRLLDLHGHPGRGRSRGADPGLDAGVAAGIRWGLGVCTLGMVTAVSMLLNGHTDTTSGAHTVGAADGGPGLPLTGWSLDHRRPADRAFPGPARPAAAADFGLAAHPLHPARPVDTP